jgi:hypothetical protein
MIEPWYRKEVFVYEVITYGLNHFTPFYNMLVWVKLLLKGIANFSVCPESETCNKF